MIELRDNGLEFSFDRVHRKARLRIESQRTLRIPDDGDSCPLPPGLGCFSLRHVDDCASRAPERWLEHGGVMLPMYQSEAMWLNFECGYVFGRDAQYPFAVKVAAGKINAVTGDTWNNNLHRRPQDYLVAPAQPWLDGYCVEKGVVRQFVAMPLGAGYSAEEQLTGEGVSGGLRIIVYPMKREVFERRFPKRRLGLLRAMAAPAMECALLDSAAGMGLAPGGRMEQEIYDDPFAFNDWDRKNKSRCFVHIANSLVWRAITGETPPAPPPTATEYTDAGLPWFEYYAEDLKAVEGSGILGKLKSVAGMGKEKGGVPLPENLPVSPKVVIKLRKGLKRNQVREGRF